MRKERKKKQCNDDCLNCSLPQCIYDKQEKEEKPKRDAIIITDFKDRNDYMRQYHRAYYQRHKERIKESLKKYRLSHKEKVNEIRRNSYYRNKEKELERQKAYNLRRALDGGL